MRTQRLRAVVCLISFCLGLLSSGAAPLMAQSVSVATTSPDARASVTYSAMNNPYYRAMQLQYYNPYQTGYSPYGSSMYNTSPYGTTPLANQSSTGTGYYNGYTSTLGTSAYDQRYANTYGNRYNPSYYGYNPYSTGYQLPGIIGAVGGLALGASMGGIWGALIGGVGGYLLGKVIGDRILPAGLGYNNPYAQRPSMVPLVTGLVGAVAGAALLSSFGMVGMMVGATAGFFLARTVMKLVAPQFYYYGMSRPTTYNQGQYYYAPGTTANSTTVGAAIAPAAATETAATVATTAKASDSLSTLQEDFYQAMRDYKTALTSGDEAAQVEARANYMAKKKVYDDAKASTMVTETDAQ